MNIQDLLQRDDVPVGVNAFLEATNSEHVHIEAGVPDHVSDSLRVKTAVMRFKEQGNMTGLLVQPLDTKYNLTWMAHYTGLFGPAGIKRASKADLSSVGMSSKECHPFPDPSQVRGEGHDLDAIFVDLEMSLLPEPHFFPIYSTEGGRIGSIVTPPWNYVETMGRFVGSDRIATPVIREDRMLDGFYAELRNRLVSARAQSL